MSIYVDKVSYKGEGYRTVVDYDKWRVAIINYAERFDWDRASQKKLERHNETDEVFVLLCGRAVLIEGGDGEKAEGLKFIIMEPNVVYNVKKSVWHDICMSVGTSVLIVENSDTGRINSDYCNIDISDEVVKEYLAVCTGEDRQGEIKKSREINSVNKLK